MNGSPRSNLEKYESTNPVVQALLRRYRATLESLVVAAAPRDVLDVGAGEGMTAAVLRSLPIELAYLGVELDGGAVAHARTRNPGMRFEQGDIFALGTRRADLVLCLEVLEHLDDPATAVEHLGRACTGRIIASVPWEPWFRLGNLARGKYLRALGNHPEHVQQFTPGTFRALLDPVFREVRIIPSFPWLFAEGIVR